jgi:hypothetical protein
MAGRRGADRAWLEERGGSAEWSSISQSALPSDWQTPERFGLPFAHRRTRDAEL